MLNLNKVGRPLARIDGGKYSGRVVSVSDQFASNAKEGDDGLIKEFRQLKIANDSKFQHIPDTTKERSIFYITGPSGSGKSTYTRKYLEQYKKNIKTDPSIFSPACPAMSPWIKSSRSALGWTIHFTKIRSRSPSSKNLCASSTIVTSSRIRKFAKLFMTFSTKSLN